MSTVALIYLHFTWWLVLFTATLLRWQLHTWRPVSMCQILCSSHLHFLPSWFDWKPSSWIWKLPYAAKEIPLQYASWSRKWRPSRCLLKLLSILKQKKFLSKHLSEGSQEIININIVAKDNKIHDLLHKTNLHYPTFGWELEWLVCDLLKSHLNWQPFGLFLLLRNTKSVFSLFVI